MIDPVNNRSSIHGEFWGNGGGGGRQQPWWAAAAFQLPRATAQQLTIWSYVCARID
jgi:hypothetical protein